MAISELQVLLARLAWIISFVPMSFFVRHVSISVEDSAIVLEEFDGDRFTARHLEIEDHALTRCTVLPEEVAEN